jgi:hypothetical protein
MQRKTIKKVTGTLHQGHYKSECQLLGLPLYALTSTPGKKVVVTTGAEKGEWIVETTNGEYTLYTKYRTRQAGSEVAGEIRWDFQFLPADEQRLKKLMAEAKASGRMFRLALACGVKSNVKNALGAELVVLDDRFVNECMGWSKQMERGESRRISVRYEKHHGLHVYGTGVTDLHAVKVSRNSIELL